MPRVQNFKVGLTIRYYPCSASGRCYVEAAFPRVLRPHLLAATASGIPASMP